MDNSKKELLVKDLLPRLLYGVFVQDEVDDKAIYTTTYHPHIDSCKPYLRPISSMTDEEMDKLFDILHIDKDGRDDDWIKINDDLGIKFFFPTGKWIENVAEAYDYLNSIHIDYRGLIPKKLAIEAPEEMYKEVV